MNTMHVEDFIVLGRTVPEDSKKFGKKVCMAGYSPDNGQFIRIYPLMVPVGDHADANGFKARHRYTVDLRRNPNDTRSESWRVLDEKSPTTTKWDAAQEVKKEEIIRWLRMRVVSSIATLNEVKASLGVLYVPASDWEGFCVPRNAPEADENDRGLFDDLEDQEGAGFDASAVKFAPYIRFRDAAGPHRLQVREWGAYLLLRQAAYANDPDALWNAPGYQRGRDMLLVVGNMCNHRTNWLVIKTFVMDAPKTGPGLFDN